MGSDAQLALVDHGDPVLGCDQNLSVAFWLRDYMYEFLCPAVVILSPWLTDRHTDAIRTAFVWLAQLRYSQLSLCTFIKAACFKLWLKTTRSFVRSFSPCCGKLSLLASHTKIVVRHTESFSVGLYPFECNFFKYSSHIPSWQWADDEDPQ